MCIEVFEVSCSCPKKGIFLNACFLQGGVGSTLAWKKLKVSGKTDVQTQIWKRRSCCLYYRSACLVTTQTQVLVLFLPVKTLRRLWLDQSGSWCSFASAAQHTSLDTSKEYLDHSAKQTNTYHIHHFILLKRIYFLSYGCVWLIWRWMVIWTRFQIMRWVSKKLKLL